MKKGLKSLKRTITTVSVGDSEQQYEASITADLEGLVVYDVPGLVAKNSTNTETNVFHLHGRHWPCTVLTGRTIEGPTALSTSVVGRIMGVFPHGVQDGVDSIRVDRVYVHTPFVGDLPIPRFRMAKRGKELHESIRLNEPITLHPILCDPIVHGGWRSEPNWDPSGDGLTFNGMITTMPVHGQGMQAIMAVRNQVEALLVLLTLLNGGYSVSVDKVSMRLVGMHDSVEMLFPIRMFDVLEFGMDYYYRNRLQCSGGLRAVGMEGLSKWVKWHSRFRNKSILDRWLFSKDGLTSLTVLEGIGRAMLRDGGCRKRAITFWSAVREVVDVLDLGQIVSRRHIRLLNDINNELVKHIGDLTEKEDSEFRLRAEPLSVLASFVVGYALLRWAMRDLPAAWDNSWRGEIERAAKAPSLHRKASP